VKKLDSLAWVSALVLLTVAAMACSTGEQQKAEPTAEQAPHGEMEPAMTEQPMQVTDPVCGMNVTTASEHRAMHEGKAYHFCSPRCAEAFAQNPGAYIKAEEPDIPSEG
jgi:YHS domain-containing protein